MKDEEEFSPDGETIRPARIRADYLR